MATFRQFATAAEQQPLISKTTAASLRRGTSEALQERASIDPRRKDADGDKAAREETFYISESGIQQLGNMSSGSRYNRLSATVGPYSSLNYDSDEYDDNNNEENMSDDDDEPSSVMTTEGNPGCMQCCKACPRNFKALQRHRRCPHTFQVLLVFFMFFLLGIVERGCFVILFYLLNTQFHSVLMPGESITLYFIAKFLIYVMYPVTGFLADAKFGHYKVIRACLCIAFIGSAFLAVTFISYEALSHDKCLQAVHCWSVPMVAFGGIGYTILGVGLTGIHVNLIPFGADQLPDASGGELSSYFHWYYFCVTLGHFVASMFLPSVFRYGSFGYVFLAMAIAMMTFLAIFVIFRSQWFILPRTGNSLRLVYRVVKSGFSARKRIINKSAFDVGKPDPSWIDKARIKYGGRFNLEEVESVKTFFRILMIVMTCVGYFAVFSQLQTATVMQTYRMKVKQAVNCSAAQLGYLQNISHHGRTPFKCEVPTFFSNVLFQFGGSSLLPLLLFLPFYERFIYTCLNGWKWFSMLARMALGNCFIVASILSALAIEVARMGLVSEMIRENKTVVINALSFHENITTYEVASPVSAFYIAIPYFFFVFAQIFSKITAVEFIYAQSPGNMKGMLIGMLFASEGIAMGVLGFITFVISRVPMYHFCSFFGNSRGFYSHVLDGSCKAELGKAVFGCTDGIMFSYIILALISIVSAIMFAMGATLYKKRRRDLDPYMPVWLIPEDRETKLKRALRKCCC